MDELNAFVCGHDVKKDHECNQSGSIILLSDNSRVEDTKENAEKYQGQIVGGSVCCTICGDAAIDHAYWM
jgi:hypothetical protein